MPLRVFTSCVKKRNVRFDGVCLFGGCPLFVDFQGEATEAKWRVQPEQRRTQWGVKFKESEGEREREREREKTTRRPQVTEVLVYLSADSPGCNFGLIPIVFLRHHFTESVLIGSPEAGCFTHGTLRLLEPGVVHLA